MTGAGYVTFIYIYIYIYTVGIWYVGMYINVYNTTGSAVKAVLLINIKTAGGENAGVINFEFT